MEDPPGNGTTEGHAGTSARREYERRKAARQARVKGRLGGLLGGVVLAITDDPASTRSWARGAVGERKLAQALVGVPGIRILHDRRVPGTRGNIDHLIVSAAGVFVVDAKLYKGEIKVRDVGGFFKSEPRLFVGGRDCSRLATNMGWQLDAVLRALHAAGFDPTPPVTPVLCFVDGEWPLLFPPNEYLGVRLEGKHSIKKLVLRAQLLTPDAIDRIFQGLAEAFPPN